MQERRVIAEFESLPGHEGQVRDLILEYANHVRAQDGTVTFEVHTIEPDASQFVVYEVYRDDDAFQEHLVHPAGARFNRALAPHVQGGQSGVRLLKVLDG